MKKAFLILLILGLSFATPEEEFTQCHKTCCVSNAGEWNSQSESCEIGYDTGGQRYDACLDQCVDNLYADMGVSGGCCGPAFLLLGLGFLVYRHN